jgi:hypothetical protein
MLLLDFRCSIYIDSRDEHDHHSEDSVLYTSIFSSLYASLSANWLCFFIHWIGYNCITKQAPTFLKMQV